MSAAKNTTTTTTIRLQLLVAVCAAAMMMVMTASAAPARRTATSSSSCPFTYGLTSQWSSGFVGQVTLTNSSYFQPRLTFEVVFPTAVHVYGWWNADMVQPAIANGGQVTASYFKFYKGAWQQGFGFSIDQTNVVVTPTITIVGVCDQTTTAAVTTTTTGAVTTTTGAVTTTTGVVTTTTGVVTTTTGAVTTTTASTTGAVVTSTASTTGAVVTTTTAIVTTTTAIVTTSSTTAAVVTTPATCPPPPPPAPATCPCNGLRVLKYRASIVSRFAAQGLPAVNVFSRCLDGGYLNTNSTCLGPNPPSASDLYNAAIQSWVSYTNYESVTGVNLYMNTLQVAPGPSPDQPYGFTFGGQTDPVIGDIFQLGVSSSSADAGLVCSDMFRAIDVENEGATLYNEYVNNGETGPEGNALRSQYFVANRINLTSGQFCACVADAKSALTPNSIKATLIENFAPTGVVSDWDAYLAQVAAAAGVSC